MNNHYKEEHVDSKVDQKNKKWSNQLIKKWIQQEKNTDNISAQSREYFNENR